MREMFRVDGYFRPALYVFLLLKMSMIKIPPSSSPENHNHFRDLYCQKGPSAV
jgi:hypothetical protein